MANHGDNARKKHAGLWNLKDGFLLKFALVRHQQESELTGALEAEIRLINKELEATQLRVRESYPGSVEEANGLVRLRELEDIRFQLLSQLHGNHLEAYNQWSPRARPS